MKASFALALLASAAFAGCTGKGEVEYSGDVHVASADLVTIEPGIQVVADADQPLFYVDGSYYMLHDGIWLRSSSYRGGFARVDHVPRRLRDLDRPQAYVHYRASQDRTFTAERQPMPDEQPQKQQEPLEHPMQPQDQPQQPLSQPQPLSPQQPPQANPMPDQQPLPPTAPRNPSPGPQPIPQSNDQQLPD